MPLEAVADVRIPFRPCQQVSKNKDSSNISSAIPENLKSPHVLSLLVTALWIEHRGSRLRSIALRDLCGIPKTSLPPANVASTGEMRGVPSRLIVPRKQNPSSRKRASAGPAISGAVRAKSSHCKFASWLPIPTPNPNLNSGFRFGLEAPDFLPSVTVLFLIDCRI